MKRIFLSLTAIATLLGGVVAYSPAHAASSDNSIWSGLWDGINLNIGSRSEESAGTSATTTAPAETTVKPAAKATSDRKIYAALGDSVAAGIGLDAKANPKGNDTLCGRSSQAYAKRVSSQTKLPLVHVACSSATAGDLVTKQSINGPNIPAQLTAAYAAGTPTLITITAGANDIRWADFLNACYVSNCATDSTDKAVYGLRGILWTKLNYAFQSINYRSNGNPPTVIVTGYYNPVSPACEGLTNKVTAAEIQWITRTTAELNHTIRLAASDYPFVKFAPVHFTGHDICSSSPWIQGLADAAPFHPTASGQRAIADAVLAAYKK
ncbi:MAG TPA: SGNH/GDSL hydrolase family protein [Candidatus Saccharimonadales bacterium]|jgi:lysophospholipase L1-like esterase